jgi:hypothetical protein
VSADEKIRAACNLNGSSDVLPLMDLDFNPVLLDDSLNEVINEIQYSDPVLAELAEEPLHQLAFRTFAWLRAGVLLGEQLMESEVPEEGWMGKLLEDPDVRARLEAEIEDVGYQIAADPDLVHARPVLPDPEVKARFLKTVEAVLAD